MIELTLIEKYGPDGWQDPETGEIFYDDQFDTPWGVLGAVNVAKFDDWEITKADGVVLFNKGFIDGLASGLVEDECTRVFTSDFGLRTVHIQASNGKVTYQLHDDDLSWSDIDKEVNCYLATLSYEDWDESSS